MSIDLHLIIEENSPLGVALQRASAMTHLTPEQAATRMLNQASESQLGPTPAEEMLGAFSDPVDADLLDQALKHVAELRNSSNPRETESQ